MYVLSWAVIIVVALVKMQRWLLRLLETTLKLSRLLSALQKRLPFQGGTRGCSSWSSHRNSAIYELSWRLLMRICSLVTCLRVLTPRSCAGPSTIAAARYVINNCLLGARFQRHLAWLLCRQLHRPCLCSNLGARVLLLNGHQISAAQAATILLVHATCFQGSSFGLVRRLAASHACAKPLLLSTGRRRPATSCWCKAAAAAPRWSWRARSALCYPAACRRRTVLCAERRARGHHHRRGLCHP
mmetsp:Transcript_139126/g.242075  ORF Transcript_139126/g.242075 Transcript_139126/m.242075 type:complete len:243 (-) Transcript_139126:815-1543(-)